ncbi:MAG TPA: ATP-binding cassette domain-containing protein, partial [Myxococcota bacterium]|nr:ATP-binding cassette domain-containing protein [Myxococcota bacterium]
ATFDKVLADLPQGLDSVINEKGVNLSGGQKQRLALTRALLFASQKDIVLLDESTSSVDPHNESEIYKNIWSAFESKTVIACIHKLNLLKLFDRIIIFAGGKIVDEGSFDALLERNSGFRAAWRQFIATQQAAAMAVDI